MGTYTFDQAMERLGIKSRSSFKHLAEKYPEAFVVVRHVSHKFPWYGKVALERFAKIRDALKEIQRRRRHRMCNYDNPDK